MSEKRVSRRTAVKKTVVAPEQEEFTTKNQRTARKQKKFDDIKEESEQQPSKIDNGNAKVENSKRKPLGNKQLKSYSELEEQPNETEDSNAKVLISKKKLAGKKQKSDSELEDQSNEMENGDTKVENAKRKRAGNKQTKSDSEQEDTLNETKDNNAKVTNSKRKRAGKKQQKSDSESEDQSNETENGNAKIEEKVPKEQEEEPKESDDGNAKVEDTKRKRAGNKQQKSNSEPPAKAAKTDEKLNKTDSDFDSMDFSSKSETKDGKAWNLKISSWNVSGLRALIKKNGLDFLKHEDPDVFCMQETKCSTKKLPPEAIIDGYHKYWCAADKEGYSGTSLFSKVKPLKVTFGIGDKEQDTEGRAITAEYEKFYLVNVYVPNSGRGLVTLPKRLKWNEALREYLKKLDVEKPVILCGDLNVAHKEIDLTNPKTNMKNAGFTKEEREGMTELLEDGYVDSFRHLYPDKTAAYTFWAYFGNARAKDVGWRLDYFILSNRMMDNICDSIIRNNVYGSDHCPITLLLNL